MTESTIPSFAPCLYVDLPLTDYDRALELQLAVVEAKVEGRLEADVILAVEHPRVFTLGRRGGRENLCVNEEFLAEKGVAVVPTDRGGNITYHGPGQLVVYPIVHLAARKLKVVDFVGALEQAMIRTAAHWGLEAANDAANRGVWLGTSKLGSVGITVRRGISFHGLALNVNTDMQPFGWINPCGLDQVQMASIETELGRAVIMDTAREKMRGHLADTLGMALTNCSAEQLYEKLKIVNGEL